MNTYLYIFRGGTEAMAKYSPAELQANMQKWADWMKSLTQSGNFKSGEPLEATGKTVRGPKKTVTDGPYAEAKDLVGGYLLITAKDLNHATELAHGCPIFQHEQGSVEVRQVRQM